MIGYLVAKAEAIEDVAKGRVRKESNFLPDESCQPFPDLCFLGNLSLSFIFRVESRLCGCNVSTFSVALVRKNFLEIALFLEAFSRTGMRLVFLDLQTTDWRFELTLAKCMYCRSTFRLMWICPLGGLQVNGFIAFSSLDNSRVAYLISRFPKAGTSDSIYR